MNKNILEQKDIENIIENIKQRDTIITPKIFLNNIKDSIIELFPNLNNNDVEFLKFITFRLIDIISIKFFLGSINEDSDVSVDLEIKQKLKQWTINDNLDIKSLILVILPFMDNIKDDGNVYKSLQNLNQLIINNNSNSFSGDLLNKDRAEVMKKELYFSNFSINLASLNNRLFNYRNNKLVGNASDLLVKNLIIQKFYSLVESIKLMTGKLYVNWINIVPVRKEDYKRKISYQTTIDVFNNIKGDFNEDNPNLKNLLFLNRGVKSLQFDQFDYFPNIALINYPGVLSKFSYESLKKIKWMIYCRNISVDEGYYYIQILSRIIPLDSILKYSYHDTSVIEKNRFNKSIEFITNRLLNDQRLFDSNRITKENQYSVLTSLLIFFVSNKEGDYSKNLLKFKNYEDEIKDDFKKNTSVQELYLAFNDLNVNMLWDYLRECLQALKYNYLGSHLFNDGKIKQNYYYYKNTRLTLKNIYNYGKILAFKDFDRNLKYSYESFMTEEDIYEIFDKLFMNRPENFISNNLRLQLNRRNVNGWFDNLKTDLENIIHDIVWESMIHNGILSEFTTNHDINEKQNLPNDGKKVKEIITKKLKDEIISKYKKSNYFFTNTAYNELPKIIEEKKNTTYIEQLTDTKNPKFNFYTYFSFNWIFQINFYHHFFYNNINYITGATGQGKSTQMPKIYAYSFKAFQFISNPKIICTQPRFDPTEGNASWVSQEVGLPISYTKNKTRFNTSNYQLQFKHSKDSHVKENCYHPYIRYVTDGTILNILKNNVFMRQQYYDKIRKKWITVDKTTVYHAILVDEAHEHNTNMDLILSDIRLTCMINKKIKLGIISATMDDDEPVYRGYYREVIQPYKNSYWIDPRMHISPPGKTTKFKINEFYSKDENRNEIFTRTISEVRKILKEYPTGQILVFSTGQADIIKLVKALNTVTSSNVITLPYFSAMNTNYKRIILNITEELPKLKNRKDRVYLEWGEKFISDKKVPNNIYKRAVIIATNVAEASITIPGLKFVVDNGYQKVRKYNMKQKTKVFSIEEISEASRLQRKGRVGRKEPGDVFYLYPKGGREKNLPKFKITQEDISDILMSVLTDQENLEETIKIHNNDEINRIVRQKLIDNKGIYYIVNPFEDRIKRNIFHEIIKFNDKNQNHIDEEYFESFYNLLAKQLLIIFLKKNTLGEIENVSLKYQEGVEIVTTEFLKAVNLTSSKLFLERPFIITLILSKLCGIFFEVLLLVPMILQLNNGLSDLSSNRGRDFKFLHKKYSGYSSDLYSIYKIVSNFKNNFKNLIIFQLIDESLNDKNLSKSKIIKNCKKLYNAQKRKYQNYINKNSSEFKKNNIIDEDTFKIFKKINNKDTKYDDELKFKEWLKYNAPLNNIMIDEFQNNNEIKYWCKENYINYDLITKYYKNLIELFIKIYTLDTEIDQSKNEKNYFSIYGEKNMINQNIRKISNLKLSEKIELVFTYGFLNNMFYRESETENYLSLYSERTKGNINNFYGNNISFNEKPTQFICCISKFEKNNQNMLNIIINLKPEFLGKYLGTIFNKGNFPLRRMKYERENNTNFMKINYTEITSPSFICFYQNIYNNVGIENHLLYNKNLNSKKDGIIYQYLKNLNLN